MKLAFCPELLMTHVTAIVSTSAAFSVFYCFLSPRLLSIVSTLRLVCIVFHLP